MKISKDYGAIATHGSKELKLQKEKDVKGISLVSYKDGMSVGSMQLTRLEAKKLKELLEVELNYKTPENVEKEKTVDIINSLTSLPSTDLNYNTALFSANKEALEKAIEIMKKGGRNATRIKACENALKRIEKSSEIEKTTEEKPKIIEFPTEDKKPKIIKLVTEGDRTYGECAVKLQKEAEQFKDCDSKYVIAGLIELCKVDADFRNNLMREDKSYGGFMEYMYKAAQSGYCVRYGNIGWLDRDTALGLAIDYYNHDSEKEEAIKKEEQAKRKAEAEAKKKNGKTNRKKKNKTA